MKVAIVEDHQIIRDLLRHVCSLTAGCELIGDAATGKLGIAVVLRSEPDLLLLDIGLPDMTGFEVLAILRRLNCKVRAMFLSGYCNDYIVHRVQQTDAIGFLDKPGCAVSSLSAAFEALGKGQSYFSENFRRVQSHLRGSSSNFNKILSATEQNLLVLLGGLLSDGEIAERMHISAETVEKHRLNITHKLNLGTRIELVRYARDHGFMLLQSEGASWGTPGN